MLLSQYLAYEAQQQQQIEQLKPIYDTFVREVLDVPVLKNCIEAYLLRKNQHFFMAAARQLGHTIAETEDQLVITLNAETSTTRSYSLDYRLGNKINNKQPVLDVFYYEDPLAATGNSEIRESIAKIKWNNQENKLDCLFNPAQYVEKTVYAGVAQAKKELESYKAAGDPIKCKQKVGRGVYEIQEKYGRTGLLIMKHAGQDLANFLGAHDTLPLSTNDRWLVGLKALYASRDQVVQKGIIHRDIKLTNFLIDSTKGKLNLCDFGSATKSNNIEKAATFGTPGYCAPEALPLRFNGEYDDHPTSPTPIIFVNQLPPCPSEDSFSLGVTLTEILGGCDGDSKFRKFYDAFPQEKNCIINNRLVRFKKKKQCDDIAMINALYFDEAKQPDKKDWALNPFKAHGVFNADPHVTEQEKKEITALLETMIACDPEKRPEIDRVIFSYTQQYKNWIGRRILPDIEAIAELFPLGNENAQYSTFATLVRALQKNLRDILNQRNDRDLTEKQLNSIALSTFFTNCIKSSDNPGQRTSSLNDSNKAYYASQLINTVILPYLQHGLSKEINWLNKLQKRIPPNHAEHPLFRVVIQFLLVELQEKQQAYYNNPTNDITILQERMNHYYHALKIVHEFILKIRQENDAYSNVIMTSTLTSMVFFREYTPAKDELMEKIKALAQKQQQLSSAITAAQDPALVDAIYFLLQELQETQQQYDTNPPRDIIEGQNRINHYRHASASIDEFLSRITSTENVPIPQKSLLRKSHLKSVGYFIAYSDCKKTIDNLKSDYENKQRPTHKELKRLNQTLTQSIFCLKRLLAYYQRNNTVPPYETSSVATLRSTITQLEDKQKSSNDLRLWFSASQQQYDARRHDPKALLQLVNEYREMINFAVESHTTIQHLVTAHRDQHKNGNPATASTTEMDATLNLFCRKSLQPKVLHENVENYINKYKDNYNLKVFTHYAAHILVAAAAFSILAGAFSGPLGIAVGAITGCVAGYYLARQTLWQRPPNPEAINRINLSNISLRV